MIGFLRGTLLSKKAPHLMVDVQGVGYELQASMTTFYDLPELGEPIALFTHLSVREDAHLLFGFSTEGERELFRTLIRVNGVGPKLALSILSSVRAEDFALFVQNDDVSSLTKVPGVGKKTAERLIVEMRDRLGSLPTSSQTSAKQMGLSSLATSPIADAVSALMALGYKPNDASRMVRGIDTEFLRTEEIIRLALKEAV